MSALPIQTQSPRDFFSHAVAGAVGVPIVGLHMLAASRYITRPLLDSLKSSNLTQVTSLTIAVVSAALGILSCCGLARALNLKERPITYGQIAGLAALALQFPPAIQVAAASVVSACTASPVYLKA